MVACPICSLLSYCNTHTHTHTHTVTHNTQVSSLLFSPSISPPASLYLFLSPSLTDSGTVSHCLSAGLLQLLPICYHSVFHGSVGLWWKAVERKSYYYTSGFCFYMNLALVHSFIASITVILWDVMNTAVSTSHKWWLLALFYYKLQQISLIAVFEFLFVFAILLKATFLSLAAVTDTTWELAEKTR